MPAGVKYCSNSKKATSAKYPKMHFTSDLKVCTEVQKSVPANKS